MRLLRLRDLVLTVFAAAAVSVASVLTLGWISFRTLFETALGGTTLLWAAGMWALAIACGVLYVLGKPACARDGHGV